MITIEKNHPFENIKYSMSMIYVFVIPTTVT